jgi:hypothetical protein
LLGDRHSTRSHNLGPPIRWLRVSRRCCAAHLVKPSEYPASFCHRVSMTAITAVCALKAVRSSRQQVNQAGHTLHRPGEWQRSVPNPLVSRKDSRRLHTISTATAAILHAPEAPPPTRGGRRRAASAKAGSFATPKRQCWRALTEHMPDQEQRRDQGAAAKRRVPDLRTSVAHDSRHPAAVQSVLSTHTGGA